LDVAEEIATKIEGGQPAPPDCWRQVVAAIPSMPLDDFEMKTLLTPEDIAWANEQLPGRAFKKGDVVRVRKPPKFVPEREQ
jgi:hypothetical protein